MCIRDSRETDPVAQTTRIRVVTFDDCM